MPQNSVSVINNNNCLRLFAFIGFHVKYNLFTVSKQSSNLAVQPIGNITKLLPVGFAVKQCTDKSYGWNLSTWFWKVHDGNSNAEKQGVQSRKTNQLLDLWCYIIIIISLLLLRKINAVQQFLLRRGQATTVLEVWGSYISWKSAHEVRKVLSLRHLPPLPQEIFLVLFSIRGLIYTSAIVRPEILIL